MPDLHPLIRVVMLLVFTAGMATARPEIIAGGIAFLALLYIRSATASPLALIYMIRRLRWLLLAILMVYGWWTPGTSLWAGAGALSPTIDGLYLGMLRVLALLTIVAAVNLLLQSTPREKLLPAIMQLIWPLTTQHARERIAVRALLSIESVSQVQSLASDILKENPPGNRNLSSMATALQRLYKRVLERAADAGETVIEVHELAAPPWRQWMIPLAMGGLILFSI